MRTRRTYTAYGGAAELFRSRDRRILLEGPANTGKSRGILQLVDWHCVEHPGIRVLLCRQTLQSLRESTQVTLEEKVWFPFHPALRYGTRAQRSHRRTYQYPPTVGMQPSTIVLGGLEDPGWTYSMEYDIVVVLEAWEVSQDSLERLYRANRNHILCRYAPENQALVEEVDGQWDHIAWMQNHHCWQQVFCDTNPAEEFHPLNQMAAPVGSSELERIKAGEMPSHRVFRDAQYPFVRILSRHEDNPACTEEDLENLRALTGHRYGRLYLGLWTSAEGMIYPEFDSTKHCITAEIVRPGERDATNPIDKRVIDLVIHHDDGSKETRTIKATFGTFDFGHRNPACLQIWGVDYDNRLYRLVELYFKEKRDDWWAERICELACEFDIFRLVCDSEDPGRIEVLNDRLGRYRGRASEMIAEGVKKSLPSRGGSVKSFVPASIDLVADWLADDPALGTPRLFFLRDALRYGRDRDLAEARKPTCTEQEIGSYVYCEDVEGKPLKEMPDPACADHGCDAMRYACVFWWLMDHDRNPTPERLKPGTAGRRLGHLEVLQRSERFDRTGE